MLQELDLRPPLPGPPRRAPWRHGVVQRCSGAEGARTPDLLGAIQALSQLSYSPDGRLNLETAPPTGNPCNLTTPDRRTEDVGDDRGQARQPSDRPSASPPVRRIIFATHASRRLHLL